MSQVVPGGPGTGPAWTVREQELIRRLARSRLWLAFLLAVAAVYAATVGAYTVTVIAAISAAAFAGNAILTRRDLRRPAHRRDRPRPAPRPAPRHGVDVFDVEPAQPWGGPIRALMAPYETPILGPGTGLDSLDVPAPRGMTPADPDTPPPADVED